MYKYNGRVIRVGRTWTNDKGIKQPYNWNHLWDDAKKAAKGLVWEDDPAPFDSRFYWSADVPKAIDDVNEVDEEGNPVLDADGNQVVTKGLKSQAVDVVKQQAGALLTVSDWMVIKASEVSGYSVPADVLAYRAAVRQASNDIEAAINAVADHDAFIALYDAPVDEEGNATGNAPINAWPQA